MNRNDNPGGCVSIIALVLIVMVIGAVGLITSHLNNSTQTITVTRLDDQASGSGKHQYLVFTDKGVFKDTDNFWLGKFNSSDLFGSLQVGHTYRCKVHGTRNHFLSNYPDLISCTPVGS